MPQSYGFKIHGVEAPFGITTPFGNGHILVPDPSADAEKFGGAVSYVDDPEVEVAKFLAATQHQQHYLDVPLILRVLNPKNGRIKKSTITY
ncbi:MULTISPECIES: hypothetical protein [Xanthomonas]|uniref:hypothetical protein n=1 Tax=Xanthomonas TaxID=338 RepID=UPI0010A975DE|nr:MULTISPECIES: hypothetical protein [Xanthomonas]WPM76641.1 hypothetical protein XVT_21485 [Xanthomonas citri pv. viticola]